MLRAFARAFAGRREPVLVTISRFGDVERLRALGRELGIDQQLITLDKPSDDEVVALFNGALGLLFCSLVEGFGLPVVEAMACGCPVVTSTSSCLPEVAGGAALLVDPLDVAAMARAMRRVAEEPSLRQELSARGLERVASLTWRKAAERHLEVYAEAVR
jgi:glycosyltransferase involved in cell wall biosynthesis